MKNISVWMKGGFGLALIAGMLAGCQTEPIKVTMDRAGEIKLNGVSKIALADFNTLDGDAFSGIAAADKETCALVKRAVAAAFYNSPMYQISDLEIEKGIHDSDETKLVKNRFDAFICGRLWWQLTPEMTRTVPQKFTLSQYQNVSWTQKVKDKNGTKVVPMVTEVKVGDREVLDTVEHREQHATLMLTLSIYRVSHSGNVEKIVDTYQVTDRGFVLRNGVVTTAAADVGTVKDSAADRLQAANAKSTTSGLLPPLEKTAKAGDERHGADGKLILTQKTSSMPTELQAKLMLASSISSDLAGKLAPQKTTFDVPGKLGDARMENLLRNGAFKSGREYALYKLRNILGLQVCEHFEPYVPELMDECDYTVPDSAKKFPVYDGTLVDSMLKDGFSLYSYSLGTSHEAAAALAQKAKVHDEMVKYVAGEGADIYFYALGVCHEAAQELEEAMECYRLAFNLKPVEASALGLARTRLALGESARLVETRKAKKSASKKTRMN